MKNFMIVFFCGVLTWMLGMTFWASAQENVWVGLQYLFRDRWAIATLSDTYMSFFIIYLWMAYKQNSWVARIVWFLLVCSWGSIAVSIYALFEIRRISSLPPGEHSFFERFLLKDRSGVA